MSRQQNAKNVAVLQPQLTLQIINKTLNQWINRQEKSQVLSQSNVIITQALQLVFQILKEMFETNSDGKHKFQEVLKTYMVLFLSTGNNQHRYLVQLHLKNLLQPSNYERFRYSEKFYSFLCQVFGYYPYLAFRILQSKYQRIFEVQLQRVIELYRLYIKFANTRKNQKLLEEYIQIEINASKGSLEKLNILLRSYSTSYRKIIKPYILKQIIDIIGRRNDNWVHDKSEGREKILKFCQTMYEITWPVEMQELKPLITLKMIKIWQQHGLTARQKGLINHILETISISTAIIDDMKALVREKISQNSSEVISFGLNAEFARIIISKMDREQAESIMGPAQFKAMIDQIITHPATCQEKIQLLETIRVKKIYQLAGYIQGRLGEIIRNKFVNQYGAFYQLSREEGDPLEQLTFALKIIRTYNFQHFQTIYCLFKQYILRNKSSKQCHADLRKEILMVCLYILKHKEFKTLEDERRAFKDILDLIGQQIQLKIMMIQYIVDHLSQRFYNQRHIYSIYKQAKYECLLYEDYTTNDMAIKIFSIKTICYLACDVHSQYTFFLKNAYYQLFDRLAIKLLVGPEEKEITLKLVREIMRHRAELFQHQADQLSALLLKELHQSIELHSPQANSVSIIIFKIFQALLKKIPLKMISYAKSLTFYSINILNFKILKKELKKIAIETFCDMVDNCNYVILPYFHFPSLYFIIREVLRSDDHYYYYQTELLRLVGRLGFLNEENFVGLQLVNRRNLKVDENFQGAFREITFLKNIKEKKYSSIQPKNLVIEDAFYSEEKVTKSCIKIQNYRFSILEKIVKHISESCLEVKLTKILATVLQIIPVLQAQEDQRKLHELLLDGEDRLFEIQSRYCNQVLNIVLKLLCYHRLQRQYCKKVLRFYLSRIYNSKRELDLVKLLCVVTDKYREFVDSELIEVIIAVKKIIMDNYAVRGEEEECKVKLCFSVLVNLADKLDHALHLFFIDLNKAFSNNQDRSADFAKIPATTSADFFSLIIHLTKKCPSIQYFLPSIRQCLIDYLYRQAPKQTKGKFLDKIINTMICLMVIYGKRCESFINILQYNLKKYKIYHVFYRISLDYFKKHSNLDYLYTAFTEHQIRELFHNDIKTFHFQRNYKEAPVSNINGRILREFQRLSIEVNHTEQQEDLWMDNLSTELFKHSSEPILRECIDLVNYDKLFAYDIFDVPFYFFWKSLNSEEQARMTMKIKNILMKKSISLRIRQKLLDAIYFIQRCQIAFLMKDKLLSDVAVEVEDQVKALFYLEREYENDPEMYREYLIQKYAEIGEKESAIGLLKSLKMAGSTNNNLYIKLLQRFSASSEDYRRQLETLKEKRQPGKKDKNQKNETISMLELEFKRDAFNWDGIIKEVSLAAQTSRGKFAHFAVEAAISLGNWQEVKRWSQDLDIQGSGEQVSLWMAMLQIHEKRYDQAQKLIVQLRDSIYYKIRQMFNFSYEKSMKGVLILQQISELQEILEFNRFAKMHEQASEDQEVGLRKKQLITLWNDRFQGFKKSLDSIQKMLFVRGLLLNKSENIQHWIGFCKLALSENKKMLGKNIYKMLRGLNIKDEIKLLQLKFIHHEIDIRDCMSTYFDSLVEIQSIINQKRLGQDKRSAPLIFEIYYRYAQGIIQGEEMSKEEGKRLLEILDRFLKERGLYEYYELSHIMGLTHIKILQLYNHEIESKKQKTEKKMGLSKQQENNDSFRKEDKLLSQQRKVHLEDALKCFLSSVTNSTRENKYFLEDCLKILNMISMGSQGASLIDIFQKDYIKIPSQGLIEFIPQIIARLDNNYGQNQKYIAILKKLLVYIGKDHPQALLFPLIFLRRGKNLFKRRHADQIYDELIEYNQTFQLLYGQGQVMVQQLCKISLKLSEKVFIFMTKILKKIKESKGTSMQMQISECIIQFCEKILEENQKRSSQSQFGFIQDQKETLITVVEYLSIYKELDEVFYFTSAIELIRQVVRETEETLNFIKMIYLEQASVKLSRIQKSNVCLFGSYTPNVENVTIDHFKNQIVIISSKQRPKKFVVVGTDGKNYNYLLKGKQDLRLDERIMQLFSFINKMFHSPSQKQNYSIQGYSITPINFQIGIISWVENCDTIGDIIVQYRKSNGLGSNIKEASTLEYNICLSICKNYNELTKYQKVEIFREVQRTLSGNDLKNIFWKRSVTSEKWLKSRSCFTRSLAVMSIVGYIIGLGDRHPFNIMLHSDTGKIIHIDFGDCFEVTKMKKSYPEKVPFRLTRMLVNVMEACKTDGIFKQTCEKIMKILRNNKESILVIVEAFRFDPLIGWKITSKGDKQDQIMVENTDYQVFQASEEKSKIKASEDEAESTKHILNNIKNKLNGIYQKKTLQDPQHVDKLIKEATSALNLVQHWKGWLIYW